jgi:DnaJ-class molecular chaperone
MYCQTCKSKYCKCGCNQETEECPECEGTGEVVEDDFGIYSRDCPRCNGTGKIEIDTEEKDSRDLDHADDIRKEKEEKEHE